MFMCDGAKLDLRPHAMYSWSTAFFVLTASACDPPQRAIQPDAQGSVCVVRRSSFLAVRLSISPNAFSVQPPRKQFIMQVSNQLFFALQLVCFAALSSRQTASATFYAPNHFLGTCLTEDWVKDMEIKLGVSASARDPVTNTLLNPFLHAALPGPRYLVRI
jgi:hypothetical protein